MKQGGDRRVPEVLDAVCRARSEGRDAGDGVVFGRSKFKASRVQAWVDSRHDGVGTSPNESGPGGSGTRPGAWTREGKSPCHQARLRHVEGRVYLGRDQGDEPAVTGGSAGSPTEARARRGGRYSPASGCADADAREQLPAGERLTFERVGRPRLDK